MKKAQTTTTYSVFVKLRWKNGFGETKLEERGLWLDGFANKERAERAAIRARKDERVIAAWVEKIEKENREK